MKKRLANMECLRILAMMMVVMLHYLSKGAFLQPLTGELSVNGYVAWFVEAFAIVAVNVYMLISGYFLVEATWKWQRLVKLWAQVLFYTLLIPVVLLGCGVLSLADLSIYKLLQYGLPAQMEHYWFITAYLITYLFVPLLSAGVKNLAQKDLRNVIIGLLLFFSVSKSLLPFALQIDKLGYDALWFMTVFLVAAYIRRYGLSFFNSAGKSLACYLFSVALTFGLTFGVRAFYLATGSLGHFVQAPYSYNHVLNLFGAVSLFYTFYHLKDRFGGVAEKVILAISPYTLGVYLLHEHIDIRTLWPALLGADPLGSTALLVPKAVGAVLVVFAVGIIVDCIRSKIFAGVLRILPHQKS